MTLPISVGPISDFTTPVETPGVPYLVYNLTTSYDEDMGRLLVPTCGPVGTPPEIVSTQPPVAVKRVIVLAIRLDGKAELPDPNTNSSQDVLLSKRIVGNAPGRLPDGTSYTAIVGEYIYALMVAPGPSDSYFFGQTPVDAYQTPESTYDLSDFLQGIISNPPSLVGFPPSGGQVFITKPLMGGGGAFGPG